MPQNKDRFIGARTASLTFISKLLSGALDCYYQYPYYSDEDFHVLTPELEEHIASMFGKSDWARLRLPETRAFVPDTLFDDDDDMVLDRDRLKAHVGETFTMSINARPVGDILSLESFLPGMEMHFLDETMEDVAEEIGDAFCETDFLLDLVRAAELARRNGRDTDNVVKEFVDSLEYYG